MPDFEHLPDPDSSGRSNAKLQWPLWLTWLLSGCVGACLLLSLALLCLGHPAADHDVLFVVGAYSPRAEVISLDDEAITCNTPAQVPSAAWDRVQEMSRAALYFMDQGRPCYCHDRNDRQCFRYSPDDDEWTRFAVLPRNRIGAAKLQFHSYVVMTGGRTYEEPEQAEYYRSSLLWAGQLSRFIPGPDLPLAMAHHCIVSVNETHALLTGGMSSEVHPAVSSLKQTRTRNTEHQEVILSTAYMFNMITGRWTRMADMKAPRYGHYCGLVNKTKVVVTLGLNEVGEAMTEVFDLATQVWHQGPELHSKLKFATSVQLEDTFLIMGGMSDNVTSEHVYEYQVTGTSHSWHLRKQAVKLGRVGGAVYRVPPDWFSCEKLGDFKA